MNGYDAMKKEASSKRMRINCAVHTYTCKYNEKSTLNILLLTNETLVGIVVKTAMSAAVYLNSYTYKYAVYYFPVNVAIFLEELCCFVHGRIRRMAHFLVFCC